MHRRFQLSLALGIVMLIVDQAVKAWIRGAIPERGSFSGLPWPGVFELTLTYNKGIAFGLFQGAGRFLSPIALVMAIAALVFSYRTPREPALVHASMGLLFAGAVGNLIDRVWLHKVTDMFWFRLINFPVFNVADACITISVVLLMLGWLREGKTPPSPAAP